MKRRGPSLAVPAVAAATFGVVYALTPAAQSSAAQAEVAKILTYYPNCDAARSAGAAPIMAGQPGYRAPLDADGDGIACEPYKGLY